MQLVDGKLYIENVPAPQIASRSRTITTVRGRKSCNLIPWLKATSATERLLVLMLAAFVLAASPALVATVRSTVSLSFQILLQAGHVGLVAFQIFGR
jgi:hypothetical protein